MREEDACHNRIGNPPEATCDEKEAEEGKGNKGSALPLDPETCDGVVEPDEEEKEAKG